MNCQFFDKNNCHIIVGVNFMTSHKYIYGNITVENDINYQDLLKKGYFDSNYGLCFPNVEVLYQRDYFSKADVRITLDSEIQYKFYQSKSGYSEKNIVVEIKSNNLNYNNIEEIYGLQKTRFSKYCEAIEHVGLSNN